MAKVAILGSVNMDIVLSVGRLPQIGETISGEDIHYFVGGKGANQSVAAARCGGQASFIGKVGNDAFGSRILTQLQKESLDLTHLTIEENNPTGIANIYKLPEDNCIVIIPGANGAVDEDYVDQISETIQGSKVLLMQMEIPITSICKALEIAKANQVITIVNPAPFQAQILDLLPCIDYITPNELEFAAMLGVSGASPNLEDDLLHWQSRHHTQIILTRGKEGISFVDNGKVVTIPGHRVRAVDTTGAGDAFNGILATQLSHGHDLVAAIRYANAGAALSVTKLGAQTGMPTGEEIGAFLKHPS